MTDGLVETAFNTESTETQRARRNPKAFPLCSLCLCVLRVERVAFRFWRRVASADFPVLEAA
jgi:hypothetical protein